MQGGVRGGVGQGVAFLQEMEGGITVQGWGVVGAAGL
jgi:hypothetical protein